MKIKPVILLGLAMLVSSTLFAQMQAAPTLGPEVLQPPMTEKEVISDLKKGGPEQLVKDVGTRGVDFEMNPDIEKRLRKAKASDDVIKAVTQAGPKERAEAAKEKAATEAEKAKGALQLSSKEENDDYEAIKSELDPDKAIALADAFAKKYPQSAALTYVYAFEAKSYESKSDAIKTVDYAEKSLALKKDNLMSLFLASDIIPQHQFIEHHQADEDQWLTKSEGYCQEAFKGIDDLQKAATEDDVSFAKRKADYEAGIHSDLGMIHLDRARLGLMGMDAGELAKSEKEYNQAISMSSHPVARDYYMLGEVYRLGGKNDDAIKAYSKAAELDHGVIKQFAERQINLLKGKK